MSVHKHKPAPMFVRECDNCHIKSAHIYEGFSTPEDAAAHAQQKGWDTGLIDLCATCACDLQDHWLMHKSALDAAYAAAFRFGGTRHTVTRCRRCRMWSISPVLDDE